MNKRRPVVPDQSLIKPELPNVKNNGSSEVKVCLSFKGLRRSTDGRVIRVSTD
jgi:hypothetical protein